MKENFNQSSTPPIEIMGEGFKLGAKLSALYLSADVMPAYRATDAAIDPEEQRRRHTEDYFREKYGITPISLAYYSMRINGVRPVDQFLEPQKHDRHYQQMRTDLEKTLGEARQNLEGLGELGKPLLSSATPSGLSYVALGILVDEHVDKSVTYMLDKDRYGIEDFFQYPAETAMYKTGDCEDFALLKRKMLRDQGVPNENVLFMGGNIGDPKTDGTRDAHATLLLKDEKEDFYILNNDGEGNPITYEKYKKDKKFEPAFVMDDDSIFVTDKPLPAAAPSPNTPKPMQQTAEATP